MVGLGTLVLIHVHVVLTRQGMLADVAAAIVAMDWTMTARINSPMKSIDSLYHLLGWKREDSTNVALAIMIARLAAF